MPKGPVPTPVHDRFIAKIKLNPETGCWEWTGAKFPSGYGNLFLRTGKFIAAHRYSFLAHRGPYDERLDLDHLCRVRHCVNPDHLEPVSRKVNIHRSPLTNPAKTHCPHGHEYTPENTYMHPRGCRICRECYRIRDRKKAAAKRAQLRKAS